MDNKIIVYDGNKEITTNVDIFSKQLRQYLDYLELPTDNVLVEINERGKVINNIPSVVEHLSDDQKERAYYISKFVASCGVGLFDAALNFLWNETIVNLREKIVRFDLTYFYDSTISDSSRRSKYSTEEDLNKLDDWELIRGCRETGIITDIGYKHLDYIRDMRNFASAAHPNQTQLTGLQLVSWLETCIVEVLAKEPSGPVLEVKKLLNSIRTETLDNNSVTPIMLNIQQLPKDLANSLLRALFGMYTDKDQSKGVRSNINLIAKSVWGASDENARYDIGLKYAGFSINAELKRKSLANKFLNVVDGLSYLTEDQLAVEINESLDNLLKAHYNFNNFYNEEPHAKILSKYIPDTGKIPDSVRFNYVKALVICKLGNSYGVSWGAMPYYNKMIKMFGDLEILEFFELLKDNEMTVVFHYRASLEGIYEIAKMLEENTRNDVIKQALSNLQESSRRDLISKKMYWSIKKLIGN